MTPKINSYYSDFAPVIIDNKTLLYSSLKTDTIIAHNDENRFTIQVGSKKELEDAKTFAAKLIDAGYDAYIQKAYFRDTDEVWFRVRVGSYDNRDTALSVGKVSMRCGSLLQGQQFSSAMNVLSYVWTL